MMPKIGHEAYGPHQFAGGNQQSAIIAVFCLALLSACGGGGGSTSSSAPVAAPVTTTSTSNESGAMGVAVVNGATEASMPGSSGSGTLLTLPNTGTLTGATVSAAQFAYINVPDVSSVTGTNLDVSHGIGVAFSYGSPNVAIFAYSPTANTLNEISYFIVNGGSASNTLAFSGANPVVAGVVLDPSNETAIVDTYDGYEIWSYANPQDPVYVKTIASSNVSPSGIDMAENFAYDPNFNLGGDGYRMILSAGYVGPATDVLELADANTGTIFTPDSATANIFYTIASSSGCSIDQIGVDTGYQVAVLGCEGLNQAILVDLNALTLDAATNTYSLPASAVQVLSTGSNSSMDVVAVESNSHTVFLGAGGLAGQPPDAFEVGTLSNPASAFGFVAPPVTVFMPPTSSANASNCPQASCLDITGGVGWNGAGDPHAVAAYQNAEGDAKLLWMGLGGADMAVIDLTQVLSNPANPPASSIWYQGLP